MLKWGSGGPADHPKAAHDVQPRMRISRFFELFPEVWPDIPAWLGLAFGVAYLAVAVPALHARDTPFEGMIASAILGAILVALSCIDVQTFRLPNVLTLPLVALGLIFTVIFAWDDLWLRIAAAGLGYAALYFVAEVYLRTRGHPGLGLGDAKLFAASGAWLGLEGLPGVLLIASLAALAWAALSRFSGRKITAQTRLAFGPFLAFGTWIVWLYGPPMFAL